MLEIWSVTDCVAPLPSVTIVMTAATPMTMPSTVRNERSRLRRMARSASSTVFHSIRRLPRCGDRSRPARRRTARCACACAAMSGSCVTMSTVMPWSRLNAREQLHDLPAGLACRGCRWARPPAARRAGSRSRARWPRAAAGRRTARRACGPPSRRAPPAPAPRARRRGALRPARLDRSAAARRSPAPWCAPAD